MTDTAVTYDCGICHETGFSEHGLKIHKGKKHVGGRLDGSAKPAKPTTVKPPTAPPVEVVYDQRPDQDSPYAGPTEEIRPKPPAWRERIWGDDRPAKPKTRRPAAERRPRQRRLSTEGIWTTAWTGAGVALIRSGADVPVGNCLQFQAPIVGEILDEAVAGTFLDRFLQPIAGGGERLKKITSVMAMPILVGVLERSPAMAPMIEPILREAIREHLVAMAPVIKARQKQEENYRKALIEMGMETGDDPIDAVIDAIFPREAPQADTNGAAAPAYATTG